MIKTCCVPLVILSLCSLPAIAQTTPASAPTVLVYQTEDGIASPELNPPDFSTVISNDCKYRGEGIVRLSLFVDSQGKSQNIAPLYPRDDDFERMAVSIASVDRFVPAAKDGVPVAVAQQLEIKLTLCTVDVTDERGQSSERLRLKSLPVQKMFPGSKKLQPMTRLPTGSSAQGYGKPISGQTGGGVQAPVPLVTPEPEYPIEQRKAKVGGICLISLIVDEDGIPQNLRVVRGINEVLNEKALETVAKFRFKPAMKGKQPVPIMMSIEISFRY